MSAARAMLHEGTFSWYELRTTDVDAAAAFYADVAGWRVAPGDAGPTRVLQRDGQPVASVGPLPDAARARGAPAHWLGHLHVSDVDEALRRFVDAGGQPLGPVRELRDARVATVRDAAGAVLALASGRGVASAPGAVAWHELHAPAPERSLATYAALFGWEPREAIELPPPFGAYRTFAAGAGTPLLGAVVSNAERPEVHAQWVHYFDVADLDAALAAARARGGRPAHEPMATQGPPGGRVVYLEDPQGGAFALRGG